MTYSSINIMIPSYCRVAMLRRCIESALDTAKNIRFTLCVNTGDHATLRFIEKFASRLVCPIFESTSRPNLSFYYNRMFTLTPWKDTVVSMIGDDMVFETRNWDLEILEEFNTRDGKLVLHCNDGFKVRDKMCVNLFTTRKVVLAQKMPFMCERYPADMIDFIWFLTATYTSILRYRDDIVIDHRHTREQPVTQWDETFRRLAPLQNRLKNEEELHYAIMYATICAANLLNAGVGTNPMEHDNALFLKNRKIAEENLWTQVGFHSPR